MTRSGLGWAVFFSLVSLAALAAGCRGHEEGGREPGPGTLSAPAPAGGRDGGTQAAEAAGSAPGSAPGSATVRDPRDVALFEAPGQVLPAAGSMAEVSPPFRAQVLEIHVQPGQQVAAGAPLVTVAMPEVLRAAGTYLGAALRVQAYESRRQQLLGLKAEGLMRLGDLSEAEARLAEARATQAEARATLLAAGLGPGDAQQLVESRSGRLSLRSPLAGTVTAVKASVGQSWDVGAGPLVRVVAAAAGRIEARLLTGLPDGTRFVLRVPSGRMVPLRLLGRSPAVDGRDGSTLAWFVPAEALPPGQMPAGLAVKVRIQPAAAATAGERLVVVPGRALRDQGGQPTVIRRSDGKAVPVRVLSSLGADALVSGALAPGDEVVLDASLRPGGEP